jgi:aminopeptidase N
MSVATGRFDLDEGVAAASGVPLRNAYPEGSADRYRTAFARTGDMVDLFTRLFGPYPFEVYGVIVVPERLDFAIENQTLSLFDLSTAAGDAEPIAAHELAHQWFGDSVSLQRWSDIWLKEGFATYAEALWLEHSRPGYDLDAEMAAVWSRHASAGPIDSPSRADLYGVAVYQRGGLTLHALRRTVGDDAFFTLLRRWTGTYRNGNATTEQFVALASEVTGRPLEAFFRSWLSDRRMPPLPR